MSAPDPDDLIMIDDDPGRVAPSGHAMSAPDADDLIVIDDDPGRVAP